MANDARGGTVRLRQDSDERLIVEDPEVVDVAQLAASRLRNS